MATDNTLEMIFKVKDDGTVVIKKASKKINKSLKGIETATTKTTKSMSKSWKKLGAVIVAAFAFDKIIDGFKSLVNAASDLEEVTSKFETVFGDNIGIASGYVDELTSSYYLSTRAAREYLASTQDLLVPMGVASEQAANLSGEVVKLAADLGSFNNVKTATVMADIQSALVGNFETMKKYGVVLNEVRVKQKAFDMGLITSIKGAIDPASKSLAAYQLVLEGSTAAIGDSIRTSRSFANLWKAFKATIEDVAGSMGTSLLPYLSELVANMTDWIKLNEEMIAQNFRKFVDGVATSVKFLADNINIIITVLGALAAIKIGAMITTVIGGMTTATVVTTGMTTATKALEIQISSLTILMSSYNKQWGVFTLTAAQATAQATAVAGALTGAGAAATTAASGMVALDVASLPILAFLWNPVFVGFAATVLAIAAAWFILTRDTKLAGEALWDNYHAMSAIDKLKTITELKDEIKRLSESAVKAQKNVEGIKGGKGASQFRLELVRVNKELKEEIANLATLMLDSTKTKRPGTELQSTYKDPVVDTSKKDMKDVLSVIQKNYNDQLSLKQTLNKQLETLDIERIRTFTGAEEAEQRAVTYKYAEMVKAAHGNEALITELMKVSKAERQLINDKYRKIESNAESVENQRLNEEKIRIAGETALKLQQIEDEAAEKLKQSYENTANMFSYQFTDAFMSFVEGSKSAKDAFVDFARSFVSQMASMILQAYIFKTVMGFIGAGGPAVSGSTMTGSTMTQTAPGTFMMAKGGAFSNGSLIPFANGGLINRPTIFPMANGIGLAGEEGTEAIMPLKRNSSGDLGVISSGGSGGNTYNYNTIQAMDSQSFIDFSRRNPGAFSAVMNDMANKGDSGFKNAIKKAGR